MDGLASWADSEIERLRKAIAGIAVFGKKHTGWGYSCAEMAERALKEENGECWKTKRIVQRAESPMGCPRLEMEVNTYPATLRVTCACLSPYAETTIKQGQEGNINNA